MSLNDWKSRCLGGVPDPVDGVLGLPERVLQVVGVAVAQLGDPGTRRYELSHRGGAGHDLGVVLGVDRGGCDGDQVREVGHAAHQLQPLGPGQLTGKGGLVDGLVSVGKGQRGVVAELVPFPVEVTGLEQRCDAGDALAVDQQRSYEGLLGLYVVGQQSLGVERHLPSPPRTSRSFSCLSSWSSQVTITSETWTKQA